jgi:HK97 family phage prohead protease
MPDTALEFKAFGLKLDSPPDDEGRFRGYAAVFNNVDHDNDIIEPGAFTKTLKERPQVPILWQHNPNEPIGVSVDLTEDRKGLRVEGQLAMEVQRAREVRSLMMMDAFKGLSIGYKAVKRTFQGGTRHLKELWLGEFSPCVFAANELAMADSIKARKWFGPYGPDDATEGVDCLLSMIAAGADFMAEEAEEGDTEDVARIGSILSSLAVILQSELDEVATPEADDGEPDVIYVEMMSAALAPAIKKLQALSEKAEPASSHSPEPGADEDDAEPVSTLRELAASIRG